MVAIDREAVAARLAKVKEKAQRREHELEDLALHDLMSSEKGRQFVWWLLDIGKVGQQPFNGASTSQTAFNCGELNVGQQVLARVLETEPAGYLQLLKDREDARRDLDQRTALALADYSGDGETDD